MQRETSEEAGIVDFTAGVHRDSYSGHCAPLAILC